MTGNGKTLLKHVLLWVWPSRAAFDAAQVFGYVLLGLCLGTDVLACFGDPRDIYLWEGMRDPAFENRSTFVITLGLGVLSTSFAIGFLTREAVRWIYRRRRVLVRKTQRLLQRLRRWQTRRRDSALSPGS